MAFAVSIFNPIVAFNIEDDKTLTAEPAEGTQVIAFDNSGNTIVVNDPVFVRSLDETVLQYMGLATAVSASDVTVQIPLQDAVGASATVWTPGSGNYVIFTGEIRDTQTLEDDDGATTEVTHGADVFGYQFKDPIQSVTLSFWVRNSTAYADWRTFRTTTRRSLIDDFNLSYYDVAERKAKTIQVRAQAGPHSTTRINHLVTSFTQRFWRIADSVYVES